MPLIKGQLLSAQPELKTEATKGSASAVGRQWNQVFCTDSKKLYISDGTQWLEYPSASGLPVGTIMAYAGLTAPIGWLICDGGSEAQADYPALAQFARDNGWLDDGSTGGGTTFFLLPDLRGKFLRGFDPTGVNDPDFASRSKWGNDPNPANNSFMLSFQDDQLRSHQHVIKGVNVNGRNPIFGSTGDNNTSTQTADTDLAGGNETRPKNSYVNFIIKY